MMSTLLVINAAQLYFSCFMMEDKPRKVLKIIKECISMTSQLCGSLQIRVNSHKQVIVGPYVLDGKMIVSSD